MFKKDSGFTLVEITIVLIILSLLVTGVSAGVAMIERSKIQSVITEFGQITSAVKAFSANYDGHLPGDLPNASDFFVGSVSDNCPGGDGDNVISNIVSTDGSVSLIESMCAWAHLSAANFLPGELNGNYSGKYADTSLKPNSVDRQQDIPVSKLSPGAYFFVPYRGINYLMFGAPRAGAGADLGTIGGAVLSQKVADKISSKVTVVDGTVLPLDQSDSILAISENGADSGPCHDGIDFLDKTNAEDKVCLLIQHIG